MLPILSGVIATFMLLKRSNGASEGLNNGNCPEFPVAPDAVLAHDPGHDSCEA
jgi:hypothetical protein